MKKPSAFIYLIIQLLILCVVLSACQTDTATPVTTTPDASPEQPATTSPDTSTTVPDPGATAITVPTSNITVQELKAKIDSGGSLLVLDIRPLDYYNRYHIEGAVSIPLAEIPERLDEVPLNVEVIVYASCS